MSYSDVVGTLYWTRLFDLQFRNNRVLLQYLELAPGHGCPVDHSRLEV